MQGIVIKHTPALSASSRVTTKLRSPFLTAAGVLTTVVAMASLFVGTLTSSWIYTTSYRTLGLWYSCLHEDCINRLDIPSAGWLMVLFGMLAVFATVIRYGSRLFAKETWVSGLIVATVLFGITGFGVLIAVYSFIIEHEPTLRSTGWSLWITLLSSMSYFSSMAISYVEFYYTSQYTRVSPL